MRKLTSWSDTRAGDVILIDDHIADSTAPWMVVERIGEIEKRTSDTLVELLGYLWLDWHGYASNSAAYDIAVWDDAYCARRKVTLHILEDGDELLEDLTRRRAVLALQGLDEEDEMTP